MFSGWVGDQNQSFTGLRQALGNCMHSAWKGYLNFGFDIGGYKDRKLGEQVREVFISWVQVVAMVPFMEHVGMG